MLQIRLLQRVYLERINKSFKTITWSVATFGGTGIKRIQDIRNSIKDMVDEFIIDYLKALGSIKPKKTAGKTKVASKWWNRFETL